MLCVERRRLRRYMDVDGDVIFVKKIIVGGKWRVIDVMKIIGMLVQNVIFIYLSYIGVLRVVNCGKC